jgi:hypothetical protein
MAAGWLANRHSGTVITPGRTVASTLGLELATGQISHYQRIQ